MTYLFIKTHFIFRFSVKYFLISDSVTRIKGNVPTGISFTLGPIPTEYVRLGHLTTYKPFLLIYKTEPYTFVV